MALNWVTLAPDGQTFVPLDNENHFFCQGGVSFEFQSGSGYPGSSELFSSEKGILFLTNLRAVYIAQPATSAVQSLSIPLENLQNHDFVQPWFGPNYFKGVLHPVPNGNLRHPGLLKFWFREGGGFSFLALLKQINRRRQELGDAPDHPEALPLYQPRSENPEAQVVLEQAPPLPTTNTSRVPSSEIAQPPINPPSVGSDLPPSYDAIISNPR